MPNSLQSWHVTWIHLVNLSEKSGSTFNEEAILMAEEICQNAFMFFREITLKGEKQKTLKSLLDAGALCQIIIRKTDSLSYLLKTDKNLRIKLSTLDQVPLEEINDIAKNMNLVFFEELSMTHRQHLFSKEVNQSLRYIERKIKILYSNLYSFSIDWIEYVASHVPRFEIRLD